MQKSQQGLSAADKNNDDSPATKLLKKRRQMYDIHEAFETQKEEYLKKEDKFKKQEQDIKEKDIQIQMELIKVCQFLQDNEEKKKRAEKRYEDEKKARDLADKEISKLLQQQKELQKQQTKLEKKVSSLKKYEDYLDSVIKTHNDQFQDLSDILNRYKTLSQSNESLSAELNKLESSYEELKVKSAQFYKDKNREILQLNNDIKDLTKKLEDKKNEYGRLVNIVDDSNKKSSDKNLNLGRILMAIDNLYNRCNEGMNKIKQDYEDSQKQNVIKMDQKEKKQEKKGDKEKKKTMQEKMDAHIDNDDNFENKSKKAAFKLDKIKNFMLDFSKILKECKEYQQTEKK